MNENKVPDSEVEVFDFNLDNGIMGLMDCGGSNLVKINEDIPNVVKIIGSSKKISGAKRVAQEFGVPLVELDFSEYEEKEGINKGDYYKAIHGKETKVSKEKIIQTRELVCREFKDELLRTMKKENISQSIPVFAAGFMSLLSEEFVDSFFILNVHPGDLIYREAKQRKIVGDGWRPSAQAIMRRHEYMYSSIHLMTSNMDDGPVLMRGYGLKIDYGKIEKLNLEDKEILRKVATACQEALKHLGDHVIAGATFMDLFEGNWGISNDTLAYRFKGEWYLVPDGIMIEDHVENNPNTPFQRDEKFIKEKTKELHDLVKSL